MKIYLSGPKSGHKDGNRDVFRMFTEAIINNGHLVVNPHNIRPLCTKGRGDWELHMAADIQQLVECDLVFVISNQECRDVTLETHIAKELGIPVIYMSSVINFLDQIEEAVRGIKEKLGEML